MATTPIPQNNSTDPQVPGNFPGTVQNPTQVPAPVNPAVDPEVSPPPNDVDPNYIPNPAPVNPASDPEVPPATTEFGGGKRFDAAPVVPATNQQVPPAQDLGSEPPIDLPQAPATSIDPQIPQPDSFPEEGIDLPQALPPADPTANNTGFDDFYGDQTYTASRTGTADAVPAASTGFDDFYGEQTYTANLTGTADARPVTPANNSQVPQAPIQNIFDLIANLFSRTPAVAPTVNPQVAQAIPVPTPKTIAPTPIPPVANPQVPAAPVVQNYFTDATPAPVAPANTGFDDYYGEQTYTANLTGTADAVPAGNTGFDDYYGEQTYTANLTGTADAVPAGNTGFDDYYGEQTYTATGTGTADARPVSPAANPEVPPPTPPAPTAESIVNQANPDLAQERFALKIQIERELQPQIARELQEQNPTWSPSRVFATSQLRAGAQADAAVDLRLDQQITAASQNPPTVTPEANPEVPQPTQEFGGGKKANPDIVDSPTEPAVQAQAETRIEGPVNQAVLQQSNPAAANDYKSYVVDTQNKIVEQQTRELEATQGYPASENQIAAINGAAFGTATVAADIKFKDQIQAADAAQSVPVNTPPPTVAPAAAEGFGPPPNDADPNFISNPGPPPPTVTAPAVTDTNQPQVQAQERSVVSNVNVSTLSQRDPETFQAWQSDRAKTEAALIEQKTAVAVAENGGQPISDIEKSAIQGEAQLEALTETNVKYKDQIEAAGAGTVTVSGTPPPTVTAPPVNAATNQQVPPPSTSKALIDPDTGEVLGYVDTATGETTDAPPAVSAATNPQVPAAQDLGSEPPIDLPQAPPATVDPQIPSAQDLGSEPPIDLPQAPPAGVDPQIPQPDSFPEEGIDIPAPVESPTPYERFLAEENAATDAAQAAATARFNAQFDDGGNIIGSTVDPQVNQGDVTDVGEFQAEPPPIPNIDTGYEDFYGVNEVNDVGEFQAEPPPIPNIDTGYEDFYGVNEVNDVGEFQAEPPPIPNIDTGYEDFYGNDEVNDVGEFQTEAKSLDNDNSGYSDFFGADAAADVGEFQTEAGTGTGESASFSNFFDGGGGGIDFTAGFFADGPTKPNPKTVISPEQEAANKAKAAKEQARQQNIINQQRKQANDGDWRVRLRLAASSNYLYNAPNPGILAPLSSSSGTSGVIFPYTPQITTAYQAKYNAYELTHSNYKGYFYQGSSVGDISINATFTAQDTQEANYLLAVIHFFRSVTKMFYGQDDSALRGAPPPLVFLQGLGEYQFNLHPCVVSNFNYTLPADVDYIRALSPNNNGTNLTDRRSLQSGVTPFINPSISRLQNAGLPQGGISTPPAPPTLGTNSPTYVPTKMDIQLTLLAIQTRSQVSNQFSLKGFANGDLIKGGFW
jgi:hypothetical protein